MAEPLSLGQLGRVLLRYWILIVAGTLLGAVLAFGATRLMTPVYRATATQLVKGQPGTGSAPSYEAAQYAVSRAKTYPSFVYNAGVLASVQEDLGTSRTVEQLRGDLTASNPVGTPLLEITAAGTTPREAADKANSAAKHLALFITKIESVNGKSPISVELAVQAALPTEAATPKTLVITALGAMIGFALATIAALLNSYVRYQRRSAFRRRQARSWASGESGKKSKAAVPAERAEAEASDGTMAAASAGTVDKMRTAPHPADGPPAEVRKVEQRPVEAAPEPVVEAVPENQPALVEENELETVSTVVLAKIPPDDIDRPAAVVETSESEILEDDDLYPTIRIADLEGFLSLSDPDRRVPVDPASDTDRPDRKGTATDDDLHPDGDDSTFESDRPRPKLVWAHVDRADPGDVAADDDRPEPEDIAPLDAVDPGDDNEDSETADSDDLGAEPARPRAEAVTEEPDAGPDDDATLVRPVEPDPADASTAGAPADEARPATNGVAANGHTNGQSAKEPVPR